MKLHNHRYPSLNATGLGNADDTFDNSIDLEFSVDRF